MHKLILLSLVAVAIAMLLLSVRIVIKKDGTFSSQHISESKAMRQRGVTCATSTDRRDRTKEAKKMNLAEL